MKLSVKFLVAVAVFAGSVKAATPSDHDNLQDITINSARDQADVASTKATQNKAEIDQLKGNTECEITALNSYEYDHRLS
ncbi:hypothetical protein [Lelliottia amnigena]